MVRTAGVVPVAAVTTPEPDTYVQPAGRVSVRSALYREAAVAALVAVSEKVNGCPMRASLASEMVPFDNWGFG